MQKEAQYKVQDLVQNLHGANLSFDNITQQSEMLVGLVINKSVAHGSQSQREEADHACSGEESEPQQEAINYNSSNMTSKRGCQRQRLNESN